MTKMMEWARKNTGQLTFVQLKSGITLGLENYQVPSGGLYVPVMTHELADRIQSMSEDKVLTVPSVIRGILFLMGADQDFTHRNEYQALVYSLGEGTKAIAIEAAKAFEKEGHFEEAVLFMRGYCQLHPEDLKAMIMLGAFYVRMAGSKDEKHQLLEKELMLEALVLLEKAYPENPKDVLLLFYLGSVYMWQKSYLKAEKTWKEAMNHAKPTKHQKLIEEKMKDVYPYARYEEGYQNVIQGRSTEGLDILTPLLLELPQWWNLHFFIAAAYQQLGDWNHATYHYGKVLEIRGYHQQTAIELSEIYLARGEKTRAVHWMEEVLVQKPGDPELLLRMALVKAYTGDVTGAYEYLDLAEEAGADMEVITEMKERLASF